MWRPGIKPLQNHPDSVAVLLLIVLWLLFFWRIFTPVELDAVSLREGDFSGQFVAWTSYAVERVGEGELPLWNPYMNAGAPFLADPQTAVYYPPRLLNVVQLAARDATSGGEVYQALQLEMAAHVLFGGLMMYAFLRRVLSAAPQFTATVSSFAGASVFAFGGYLSAYPQLQLPILESAVWAPLVLLGVHVATEGKAVIRWNWLLGASGALTLSVLAGHPQTYVLLGYTAAGYLLYRLWGQGWRRIVLALLVFGAVTGGLSALQLLPTLEFQQQTYRQEFGFDDKSAGLAAQDVLQVLFPGILGEWSPLYIGIVGLMLAGLALWQQRGAVAFWGGLGVVGLLLAYGRTLALYSVFYVLLPGYSLFRGQERVVFLVVLAASVLVAYGVYTVQTVTFTAEQRRLLRRVLVGLLLFCAFFALVFFFLRLQPPDGELFQPAVQAAIYATAMVAVSAVVVLRVIGKVAVQSGVVALVVVLVFDLFSVNLNNANFEPIPASDRLPVPAHIPVMQANLAPGQHAEGLRGVRRSYGALYRVPDIWGDSPLRLDAMDYYLWRMPIENRWELLGVQVVNSEWEMLPVPHQAVGTGTDVEGQFTVYQLTTPRPFAHLVYAVDVMESETMRETLAGLDYDLRNRVMLDAAVNISDGEGRTSVNVFEPEYIEISVETTTPAVLTLALPYMPGWNVMIDGETAEIIKAYDGLAAVVVPEGTHTVMLRYEPLSVYEGLGISLLTLVLSGIAFAIWRRESDEGTVQDATES
jgi:hypothetical protein